MRAEKISSHNNSPFYHQRWLKPKELKGECSKFGQQHLTGPTLAERAKKESTVTTQGGRQRLLRRLPTKSDNCYPFTAKSLLMTGVHQNR